MKREPSAYSIVRNMDVNEQRTLPVEKWNAARSAASYLNAQYGTRYTVNLSSDRLSVTATRIA